MIEILRKCWFKLRWKFILTLVKFKETIQGCCGGSVISAQALSTLLFHHPKYVASWSRMVAPAPAIIFIFQPARRRKGERIYMSF